MGTLRPAPFLVFLAACQAAPDPAPASQPALPGFAALTHPALRDELLLRMEKDQALRKQLGTADPAAIRRVADECLAVDADNTAWLKQVVATHGWPSRTLVGKDGAFAAWLLVQHADRDHAFQAQVLPTLQELAMRGEVDKRNVAYLTDRVLCAQGKPQLYGTQYVGEPDGQGGFTYPPPIVADPDRIDERRAEMGLGPCIEYERRMAEIQKRTELYSRPRGPESHPAR